MMRIESTPEERAEARRRARAEREAAREERRRRDEELAIKKAAKKKSSLTPAKWHWKGGVRIGGTVVKGFFYGGSNMSTMVEPRLSEPSLLDPTLELADTAEGAAALPPFPCYQYLSLEQRRGYVEFLAGDREKADDIGYVFIYLDGLERRLIVDMKKPEEVSAEERAALVDEVLRVLDVFGSVNKSIYHYASMLLLYDGSIFNTMEPNEISYIYGLDTDSVSTMCKSREEPDAGSDAMAYMLVSRLIQHNMVVPPRDLVAAAKGRLLRSSNVEALGVTKDELYQPSIDKLLNERFAYVDPEHMTMPKSFNRPQPPVYFAASASIRRKQIPIDSSVCPDLEKILPMKGLADIIVAAQHDIAEAELVLSSQSLREIGNVSIDALAAVTQAGGPLAEFLDANKTVALVPLPVLEKELKARFNVGLSYTAKGMLTTGSQTLIGMAAALLGWQAVLPELVECPVTSFWRIDSECDGIAMFYRGTAHDRRNGKRHLGYVFGNDSSKIQLEVPGDWLASTALAFVLAWTLSRASDSVGEAALSEFSSRHYPCFEKKFVRAQSALFLSIMRGTYAAKISSHALHKCVDAAGFEEVKDVLFSMCDACFGRNIPASVLEAIEYIYDKAGQDKSMVLYDYQSGAYHVVHEDNGFSIDAERLAATIGDTDAVQSMINDAIADGVEIAADQPLLVEDKPEVAGQQQDTANDFDVDGARVALEEIFDGGDEMETSELLSNIMEKGFASTTAEAMGWISQFNEAVGEELVEIDGADAYFG